MRRAARRLSSQILVLQLLILTGTLLVGFALALHDGRGRVDREYEQRALVVARERRGRPRDRRAPSGGGDRCGTVQRRAEAVRRATRMDFVVVADAPRHPLLAPESGE